MLDKPLFEFREVDRWRRATMEEEAQIHEYKKNQPKDDECQLR